MRRSDATSRILGIVVGALLVVTGVAGAASRAADGPGRVIVAFGDSLTAGLGVAPDEAYPSRLDARLRREGAPYRVVNAGVSGDTTAGALRRVDWALRARPEIVIVALGANDGLRGQSVRAMRENLEAIVTRFREAGARVLLCGMRLPPNYGEPYGREFAASFPAVARRTGVPLMPFLLDGVAADPRLNQPDGIHPNAQGHRVIAERLWPYLEPLLRLAGTPAVAIVGVATRRVHGDQGTLPRGRGGRRDPGRSGARREVASPLQDGDACIAVAHARTAFPSRCVMRGASRSPWLSSRW
jgi:acyl-CoA thioesterase-1